MDRRYGYLYLLAVTTLQLGCTHDGGRLTPGDGADGAPGSQESPTVISCPGERVGTTTPGNDLASLDGPAAEPPGSARAPVEQRSICVSDDGTAPQRQRVDSVTRWDERIDELCQALRECAKRSEGLARLRDSRVQAGQPDPFESEEIWGGVQIMEALLNGYSEEIWQAMERIEEAHLKAMGGPL